MGSPERRFTRRELIFGAIGVGGLAVGAYALFRPRETQPSVTFTSSTQTSKPETQKSQTLESQAKETIFAAWIKLLSSSESKNERLPYSGGTVFVYIVFKMETVNLDLWKKYFSDIIRSNTHPTNVPLKAKWSATSYREDSSSGIAGDKFFGEIEFNNIKLKALSRALSDSDKANGLAWAGFATIDFIRRSRSIYASAMGKWTKNREAFMRWLSTTEPDLPEFSPWENEQWDTGLVLKNGVWQRDRVTIPGLLKDFESPSKALSQSTRTIRVDIN